MKLVMINGPSCVGKSTTVQGVMESVENYYKLSGDHQKWMFSKYHRDIHKEDTARLLRAIAREICEMKYKIICDSALYRKNREALLEIARSYGYEIIEINLEADYDLLAQRFDERIAEAAVKKVRYSNTSKEVWKDLYNIYQEQKNPAAITLYTDKESKEQVIEKVLKLL